MQKKSFQNASTDRLFQTIASLNSVEECYAFFEDLCTIREIGDMAQRLDTAILLDAGETYEHIAAKVGISTATISRVSRALSYGANGYHRALNSMPQESKDDVLRDLRK